MDIQTKQKRDGSWVASCTDSKNSATGSSEAVAVQKLIKQISVEEGDFSGKTSLRMGETLHKRTAEKAAQEEVSLNEFIVGAIEDALS